MSGNTYTQQQILSGLRIIWRETLDYDDPLDLDISFMAEFMDGGMFAEIDFGDVAYRIQRAFGFTCARDEWKDFLGLYIEGPDEWNRDIAPRLTFRALVDFIRTRLEPISLGPIPILGKPCRTAGIYRGLERLAGQVHPKVKRFGPSTPIRERLRGSRLQKFWDRLRWITKDQISLPCRINPGCGGLFVKIGIALIFAWWKRDLKGLGISLGVALSLFIPTALLIELLNSQLNPLPKGIETFGDLARYLAAIILDQQSEAASCSMP